MAVFQLLVSLWPFLKEMLVGEKIKDKDASAGSATGTEQDKKKSSWLANAASGCVDKMQKSRRFLAIVLLVFMLSLFINYKVIGKLIALAPQRSDEHTAPHQPPTAEKKELPTIPQPDKDQKDNAHTERDAIREQTVRELKVLYGEPQS